MSDELTVQGKSIHYESEYLEYALRLLLSEKRGKSTNWYSLFINSFLFFFIGTFVNTLITGLILLWFNATLGRLLLFASGGSFIFSMVFTLLSAFLREDTNEPESTNPISQLAERIFSESSENSNEQFIMGLFAISWLVGLGLLIHGVVALNETSWLGLGLTFIYILFAIAMGVQEYRRKQYLSQVARLSNELEERLLKDETKTVGSDISVKDFSLLVKAQKNEVKRITDDLPELLKNNYSLMLSANASQYLKSLPENQYLAIHEMIYSLQTNPRPSTAQAIFGQTDHFVIRILNLNHEIHYAVDSVKHIVNVTDIRPLADEEALRGS
jgi:mRNA-degrading endonuclease RelE of RelBE toxin-antitoxin system